MSVLDEDGRYRFTNAMGKRLFFCITYCCSMKCVGCSEVWDFAVEREIEARRGLKYRFSPITSEVATQNEKWRYVRLQWSYAEYSSVSNVVYWPVDPTISPFDRFSGSREFWVRICENMSKIRKIVTRDLGVRWERWLNMRLPYRLAVLLAYQTSLWNQCNLSSWPSCRQCKSTSKTHKSWSFSLGKFNFVLGLSRVMIKGQVQVSDLYFVFYYPIPQWST